MNRLDKAARESGIAGGCMGLASLRIERVRAGCTREELTAFARAARESAQALMDFAGKLTNTAAGTDDVAASAARYLGSKGGKAGGAAGGRMRMAKLTVEERRQLGRRAAAARWKTTKGH